MHRYILESFPLPKLDHNRKRVRQCPCGKGNADGKFIPYAGFDDRGYCHSCDKLLSVAGHTCPGCKRPHALNLYVDTAAGNNYLGSGVGKCLFCSYHYPPKQFFEDQKSGQAPTTITKSTIKLPSPGINKVTKNNAMQGPSLIDPDLVAQSVKSAAPNYFVQFLRLRFGTALAEEAVYRYRIGTARKWSGATIFWQIDEEGRVRTGKIMLYNPETGERVKEPQSRIAWVHRALHLPNFGLKQCLFGLHLIAESTTKPVALCESEKTAVIGSICFPQFTWLATGGKAGLSQERCQALKGRHGILLPDLNSFADWKLRQADLDSLSGFHICDILQNCATEDEIVKGLDMADYLLRFPLSAFRMGPQPYYSAEIRHFPTKHNLSQDFGGMILQGAVTKSGVYFDLLLNPDEDLLEPGKDDAVVAEINNFFQKSFVPALLDNTPCFIHLYQ